MVLLRPAGRHVTEIDHCPACRLVWFDALEFDSLDRAGWVALLLALADNRSAGSAAPAAPWSCPRCDEPLHAATGQTQHGRHGHFACPAGHGHAQRSGALLASRGLFRPWLLTERLPLATGAAAPACLHCGAPLDRPGDRCSHCGSPLLVADLPRLVAALGGDTTRAPAPPGTALRGWPCGGCGTPLDPTLHASCPGCGRALGAPWLAELAPWLRRVGDELAAAAARAGATALAQLPAVERRRVATTTGRAEHRAAVARLGELFWRRLGLVGAAFAIALLMAFCAAR